MLPVIDRGPYSCEKVNAADQRRDPDPMLNWTERIVRMCYHCYRAGGLGYLLDRTSE